MAIWGIRFLTLLLANGQTNFTLHAALNWHVLAVAAALSVLTGVLFGLAPALESTRIDVISAMKEMQAGKSSGPSLHHALVIGQIALSLLLLVAAGLFIRTLENLQLIDLGFNRENLLLFQMNARQAGHKDPEIAAFYADPQKRFSVIPGVRGVSLSRSTLIEAGIAARVGVPRVPPHPTLVLPVGPGFFKTMQIPLLAGREIDEHEQPGSLPVAVVNETFAKANFGGRNPIAQRIAIWNRATSREAQIVGVSRNARDGGVKQSFRPVVYVPYNQGALPLDKMVYALRTAGDPLACIDAVREIVHRADAHVPLSKIKTQATEIDQTINQEILFAKLCTAFAILALAIACVGLYGTISYDVARRTGEIGIRMVLGAERVRVLRMILREGLLLALAGLAIGMATALGASKFVASFLYGMKANDPLGPRSILHRGMVFERARRIYLGLVSSLLLIAISCDKPNNIAASGYGPVTSAIISEFDKHDLVALGESHDRQQDLDLRLRVVNNPEFPAKVHNIVVECGNALYQDVLDRYIAGEEVSEQEIRKVWRDTVSSPVSAELCRQVVSCFCMRLGSLTNGFRVS